MSCGYCGNSYSLCEKSDMFVCEDCYDNLKFDYCISCDENIKEYCKIFNTPSSNNKKISNMVFSFFIENNISCLEDIYQNPNVAENALTLLERLFEVSEKEICDELEDLWLS